MAENSKPLDPLLDLLVQNGVLDDGQVETILEEAKNPTGKTLRQILIDGEYVTEDDLLGMMAAYQGCEVVDLSDMTLDTDTVQSIPTSVARMYNVLAVAADDTSVTLATSDLIDPRVSDELAFVLTKEVRFVMAREEDVRNRISQYYGDDTESVADMLKSLGSGMDMDETIKSDPNDVAALEGAANNNAVVKFVNLILYQGVVDRAADIHIEPFEKDFQIRYRVDGALYAMKAPDVSMAPAIISRVKIMAGLNIAERRVPQDGRIAINVAGRPVDLRVSCLPTVHGESVVMRILDQSATSLDLENVGLAEDVYEQITMDIEKPNGIIVVTGPTGSGKTTTLYSVLRRINSIDTKILTAEEPVEYDVDGIVQVPINHEVGNTFPKVLRAFLRQDPSGRPHGPLGVLHPAHERRRRRGDAFRGYERAALHGGFDTRGGARPATSQNLLQGVQAGVHAGRRDAGPHQSHARPDRRASVLLRQGLQDVQRHGLQGAQGHLRVPAHLEPDPRADQQEVPHAHHPREGPRARHAHHARRRRARDSRRLHDRGRGFALHLIAHASPLAIRGIIYGHSGCYRRGAGC